MSLLASILQALRSRELVALDWTFKLYALLSFFCVASYAATQLHRGRLIKSENPPIPFVVPGVGGWFLIMGVLALLFLESPFYMILVVFGVSLLMALNGKTAQEQFGLRRLSASKILVWSLLICGAVVFVEIPLIQVTEAAMNMIHLPHPPQQAVEMFQQLSRPSQIAGFMVQAVLISPLIEELFFRGFLLTFLKNYTSTLVAIVLSAGIFAFAHANFDAAIPLWMLGIVLGIAYQHTGSLFLPIGIHACWNFFTAINLILEKGNG